MCGLNNTEGDSSRFWQFTLMFWILMETCTGFNQFAATLSPNTGMFALGMCACVFYHSTRRRCPAVYESKAFAMFFV